MGIHFLGLKDIDKPVVWVFPEVIVCLDYVRKTDAGRQLLLAVDAVLRGEQFISSSNGFKFTAT